MRSSLAKAAHVLAVDDSGLIEERVDRLAKSVQKEISRRLRGEDEAAVGAWLLEAAGVEFIDENGGGPGVRLKKRQQKKKT